MDDQEIIEKLEMLEKQVIELKEQIKDMQKKLDFAYMAALEVDDHTNWL